MHIGLHFANLSANHRVIVTQTENLSSQSQRSRISFGAQLAESEEALAIAYLKEGETGSISTWVAQKYGLAAARSTAPSVSFFLPF